MRRLAFTLLTTLFLVSVAMPAFAADQSPTESAELPPPPPPPPPPTPDF